VADVNYEALELHVVITKSGIEDRMPISSDLAPELRAWMTAYARALPYPLQGDHYLFPAQNPSRLMSTRENPLNRERGDLRPENRMTKPAVVVQRALRALGLDIAPGEGFHTLRRSAARAFFDSMAAKGHDEALRMTSAYLHHSSTQTTEVYLGLQHERLRRDEALRGQPFLSAMVTEENVVRLPLRAASDASASERSTIR
jgi:integrase